MASQDLLRQLPSVDELLNSPALAGMAGVYDRSVLVNAARRALDQLRSRYSRTNACRPHLR